MPGTDYQNDWTLDVNVLISANRGRSASQEAARQLLLNIAQKGYLCWNSSVASAYSARGAVCLSRGCPPVPVRNASNATWMDAWLGRPDVTSRIYTPKVKKLTGSEEEALSRSGFRDRDDFRFIELARSSTSMRLVTREADFNQTAQDAIYRHVRVQCLGYEEARDACATFAGDQD